MFENKDEIEEDKRKKKMDGLTGDKLPPEIL